MFVLTEYALEPLQDTKRFTLYRAHKEASTRSALVRTASAAQLSRNSSTWLECEYSLRETLDSAWAVRPVALARHEGHLALVLEDPGGSPLDLILLNRM